MNMRVGNVCCRCGGIALFAYTCAERKIPRTDYCMECFAVDHPQEEATATMAMQIAQRELDKKLLQ